MQLVPLAMSDAVRVSVDPRGSLLHEPLYGTSFGKTALAGYFMLSLKVNQVNQVSSHPNGLAKGTLVLLPKGIHAQFFCFRT